MKLFLARLFLGLMIMNAALLLPTTEVQAQTDASVSASESCAKQRNEGRVFLPAFNDACDTLPEFIQTLIDYVLLFSSVIAGIMFLRSAYGILVSRGDPSALADAKDTLLHAILGIVLVAVAYALLKVLNGAFGSISPGIDLLGPFIQLPQ